MSLPGNPLHRSGANKAAASAYLRWAGIACCSYLVAAYAFVAVVIQPWSISPAGYPGVFWLFAVIMPWYYEWPGMYQLGFIASWAALAFVAWAVARHVGARRRAGLSATESGDPGT